MVLPLSQQKQKQQKNETRILRILFKRIKWR